MVHDFYKALKGKNALVTGSTSGIGLGIARGLAGYGVNIILNSLFNDGDGDTLSAQMAKEYDVKVVYVADDVGKPDTVDDLVQRGIDGLGSIDILVNNAGIQHVEAVDTFPIEKWQQILAVDLSSAFYATRLVLPDMKQRGWGRIINIASAHALVASPYKSAYVSAKHGIYGFTKTVALEAAEHNITVNAICPGYVLTPLVEKQIPETAKARGITEEQVKRDVLLAAQPTKKFVTVEEVAATTCFLCTDGAASITGTAIAVDGGWTAH